MKYFDTDICALTLISSEMCSLKCKYCTFAKANFASCHSGEQEKLIESLQNGKYINNIFKIFERFKINYDNVKTLNLWGEEPTLTLKYVSKELSHLKERFKNINHFFFSTNGMQNMEDIVDWIQTINKLYPKSTIDIQFSYDGEWSTKEFRGADPEKIINNLKTLILSLNEIELHSHVFIPLHSVLGMDIIHKYDTEEKIQLYWDEFINIIDILTKLNTNPQVEINEVISPGIVNPYNASKQDGIDFINWYKLNETIYKNKGRKYEGYTGIIDQYATVEIGDSYESEQELNNCIVDLLIHDYKKYPTNSRAHLGCSGGGWGELKVRYDGTTMACQNSIAALTLEEIEMTNDKLVKSVESERLHFGGYPNLITDSDETIDKYFYRFKMMSSPESEIFMFSETVSLMNLLAAVGQIDPSYLEDPSKLLRHAFLLSHLLVCWINSLFETGSVFGKCLGFIRQWCNGGMDEFEQAYYQISAKKHKERNMNGYS